MGYAATAIVVLGVQLSDVESKKLIDGIHAKLGAVGIDSKDMEFDEILEAWGCPQSDFEYFWGSDGADSRIHSTRFFSEHDRFGVYALGLMVASSGYGGAADIPKAIASCSRPDWREDFDETIGKLISDVLGKKVKPEPLVVTQVW